MKLLFLLAVVFSALTSVRADQYTDAINAENYPLSQIMAANKTFAGVCVDSQVVEMRTGQRGLVPALTTGILNFTFGTRVGVKRLKVKQYVVRLDQPRGSNEQAQLITVVQGSTSPMIEPGTPVFIATSGGEYSYSARVIPAKKPEVYPNEGMEEKRQASLDR